MNRISPQHMKPRFSYHQDVLYQELKARQLEYINLIKELHEENHRLRNLVSDQQNQIKSLTQHLAQPQKYLPVLEHQRQFVHNSQNIPNKPSPINSFSQPVSLKRIQLPRNQSPNMNPTVLCQSKSTRFQTLQKKENECVQDLPSVKPEEIFKQVLRKRRQFVSDDLNKRQNSKEKKKVISNLQQPLKDVKQQQVLKEDSILEKRNSSKIFELCKSSQASIQPSLIKSIQNKPQMIKVNEASLFKEKEDLNKRTQDKMRSRSPLSKTPRISNKIYL